MSTTASPPNPLPQPSTTTGISSTKSTLERTTSTSDPLVPPTQPQPTQDLSEKVPLDQIASCLPKKADLGEHQKTLFNVATNQTHVGKRLEYIRPTEDIFNSNDPKVKEDIIRMVVQYLNDEGYHVSKMTVMDEANVKWQEREEQQMEVKRMKKAILDGDWAEVDKICSRPLVKNQKSFLYSAYKQQYLEYIEHHEIQKAFTFLNKRLKPLEHLQTTPHEFKDLCYLLTAKSVHEVPEFKNWEGIGPGRERLIEQFQSMVDFENSDRDGSVYVQPQRLLTLLRQAVAYQIEFSRYHPKIAPKITTLLQDYTSFVIPNSLRNTFVGHRGNVKCVDFIGEEGRYIVSGSSDNTCRIWHLDSALCLSVLEGHTGRIWDIASNKSGNIIASASGDETVRLWDLRHLMEVSEKALVEQVLIEEEEDYAQGDGAEFGTSGFFNMSAGGANSSLAASGNSEEKQQDAIDELGEKARESLIMAKLRKTGSGHRRVSGKKTVWKYKSDAASSLDSSFITTPMSALNPPNLQQHSSNYTHSNVSHIKIPCIATLGGRAETTGSVNRYVTGISMGNASSGSGTSTPTNSAFPGLYQNNGYRYGLGGLASSSMAGLGGIGGSGNSGDPGFGRSTFSAMGHGGDVYSVRWHPGGSHIVTGGYDKIVRLFDVTTEQIIKTFTGHQLSVSKVIFNPLGNLIISGSKDSTIKFWDIVSGVCIKTITSHLGEVTNVEVNSNGTLLLSSSKDNSNRLWDIRMLRPIRKFRGHQNTSKNFVRAGFAGDSIIVGGSEDGLLYLWDQEKGSILQRLRGHSGVVYNGVWNAAQNLFVSCSDDRTVRSWWFDEEKPLFED